jgi:uncharacterized membrane protein
MNGGPPSSPLPNTADGYGCGPGWGRPWAFWPLVPLAIVGAVLGGLVVLWSLGLSPSWTGPAPFFWPIFPLGVLFGVLVIFVFLRWTFWGRFGGTGPGWYPARSPEEILRTRYAEGELTEEEYRRMKAELSSR